jgi:hypothetical protein
MTKLYKAVTEKITEKLKTITTANNYSNNACILEGFMNFYAEDLVKGHNGLHFPAVAVHYERDTINQQSGSINAKTDRTVTLVGAVSTATPSLVNSLLDDLLFDVKVALATERNLTITDVVFMLPENNVGYAMFSMTIKLTQTEEWKIS